MKCHPEPVAMDLAAALFAAAIRLVLGGFARPRVETARDQANRSACNARARSFDFAQD
jgi:hypothetical protein